MTEANRGPIVVDTNVFGAGLVSHTRPLAERYDHVVVGRRLYISAQTIMELRFGALHAGWGRTRWLRLAALIAKAEPVWVGADLTRVAAELRNACARAGHPLAQNNHTADLWIAATAVRLDLPLVSDDGIFEGVPGLRRERPADP